MDYLSQLKNICFYIIFGFKTSLQMFILQWHSCPLTPIYAMKISVNNFPLGWQVLLGVYSVYVRVCMYILYVCGCMNECVYFARATFLFFVVATYYCWYHCRTMIIMILSDMKRFTGSNLTDVYLSVFQLLFSLSLTTHFTGFFKYVCWRFLIPESPHRTKLL